MNRKIGSIFIGITLIAIGTLLTLENYIDSFKINWQITWPIFLILPGLFLWSIWLSSTNPSKDYKILIPANLLIFIGIISFVNTFIFNYSQNEMIWSLTTFMYPGAFALAFWIAWAASEMKDHGLKTLAIIVTIITLVSLILITPIEYFQIQISDTINELIIPTILLFSGVVVIFSPLFDKKEKTKFEGFEERIESAAKKIEDFIENTFENNEK
ncbi:hypothetical protein KC669_04535 [Candidatus Dojkabacteria bacterium]|uniref:LiaI-LiaF-like transmembrane region domain-containing protein n=1 Tax=Candidatus Dojkabacteria bacterium TaxID=2099670 RepID=A0A955LBU3_9BACT|nr:hypothetical protein [Candidatus Dojkabacteria bacterium]